MINKGKRFIASSLLVMSILAMPATINATTVLQVFPQKKDSDNKFETGWQVYTDSATGEKAKIYVLNPEGTLAKGELCIDNKWYFFNPDNKGALVGNCWVYNGNLVDSLEVDYPDKLHYYKEDGTRAIGWVKTEDSWLHFDNQGRVFTGWKNINNKWYYFHPTFGTMLTGWKKINNAWYYLNTGNGTMKTGWFKENDKWYNLNEKDGSMLIGWQTINNKWYYFNRKDGTMQRGWLKSGDNWYYLLRDGTMRIGKFKIKGVTYTADKTGRCSW